MRLFQNSGTYPAYLARLNALAAGENTFAGRRAVFLADRYGACHILKPVHDADPAAFYTNGDDATLQRLWANEQGMPADATPADILRAQIESHRTEVFYNTDPVRYGSDFLRTLPSSVKRTVCWRAAPSKGTDLSGYDRVVNNFPSILAAYRDEGLDARPFFPAHDPVLDGEAARTERPIDVLFVGGYSRHHRRRAQIMAEVAALNCQHVVRMCLQRSRLTRLAESPLGRLLPLGEHRRPREIRAVSAEPVFGRELHALMGQAKIVLNGAIDMANNDRGNIRCFESLGAGCAMVSDSGDYPAHFVDGQTHVTYDDAADAVCQIVALLAEPQRLQQVAAAGHAMLAQEYSPERQWQAFTELSH